MTLGPEDHARDAAGLSYVYPVVSRRAEGVSLGVNLNPNNACNWRCVYCQVPGLVRGRAPEIDLALLERELRGLLGEIVRGDWLARHAPEGARRLVDVAFSGNGEPTSSPQFRAALELARSALGELGLLGRVKLVLITNGSLVHQKDVQAGLRVLAGAHGELWFKLDSATDAGMRALNDVAPGMARVRANLRSACELAPTWIQTCVLALSGAPPGADELGAYEDFLRAHLRESTPPRGILLYGIARPSHQPEAPELTRLPAAWLERRAERLRTLGLEVRVYP
ncbi:MAG: radical SAM protein [Planctomycetes bacterium]|nr:radical SAM protein [Planctomycetota bacterium]